MFQLYFYTNLEKWIYEIYKKKGILNPDDLTITNLASVFNIEIKYLPGPNRAIWDEETSVVFLNPNKSEAHLREVFFHELCHILRHYGDQRKQLTEFRKLQETQANQFMLYASMPYYMITELEAPAYEDDFIAMLAYVFDVPLSLAKKRVDQIKRREYEATLTRQTIEAQNNYKRSNDPANWSEETKAIMAQLYGQIKKKGLVSNG